MPVALARIAAAGFTDTYLVPFQKVGSGGEVILMRLVILCMDNRYKNMIRRV